MALRTLWQSQAGQRNGGTGWGSVCVGGEGFAVTPTGGAGKPNQRVVAQWTRASCLIPIWPTLRPCLLRAALEVVGSCQETKESTCQSLLSPESPGWEVLVSGVAIPTVATMEHALPVEGRGRVPTPFPAKGPANVKSGSGSQLPFLRARTGGTWWQVCVIGL